MMTWSMAIAEVSVVSSIERFRGRGGEEDKEEVEDAAVDGGERW